MSRKNSVFVVLIVVLLSLMNVAAACESGDGSGTGSDNMGNCTQDVQGNCMEHENPVVTQVKEVQTDVAKQLQDARDKAQKIADQALDDAQNPEGNPFGYAGTATEQYCADPNNQGNALCQ